MARRLRLCALFLRQRFSGRRVWGEFGRDSQSRTSIQLQYFVFGRADDRVVFVVVFKEIGDVEKRVPFESDVYKCGLHPGQHACDAPFVDAAGEGILFFALVENFDELVVFEDRYSCFVAPRGDD